MDGFIGLFSINNIDLFLIIIRLCIIIFLGSFLLLKYFKNKQIVILYLIASVFLLALSEISLNDFNYTITYTTFFNLRQIFLALLSLFYAFSLPLLASISSIYFLLLFFQKLEFEPARMHHNQIFRIFFLFSLSGLLITTIILEYVILQIPDKTFTVIPDQIFTILAYLAIFYSIFMALGIAYVFLLPLEIIKTLNRYIHRQHDVQLKKSLERIRFAVLLINFGGLLGDPLGIGISFGSTVPIIAFAYLIYIYSKNGIYAFKNDSDINNK